MVKIPDSPADADPNVIPIFMLGSDTDEFKFYNKK